MLSDDGILLRCSPCLHTVHSYHPTWSPGQPPGLVFRFAPLPVLDLFSTEWPKKFSNSLHPPTLLWENKIGAATVENSMKDPLKAKNRDFLTVQWVKTPTFIARGRGSISGWGTKIQHATSVAKEKKLNMELPHDPAIYPGHVPGENL